MKKKQKGFRLLAEVEQKKRLKTRAKFFIRKSFRTPFSLDIFRLALPLMMVVTFLLMIFYGKGERYDLFLTSPLLIIPIKLVELIFKKEAFSLAFLIVSLLFVITPAAIIIFQYLVTKNWQISFFSSLIFCFIFCYCLLVEKIESPRILLKFGEGEHIASLWILLLASLLFWDFLKKGTVKRLLMASVAIGLLALCSKTTFLAFFVFLAIFSFSEIFLRSTKTTIKRVILSFVCAGGLMAFWFNPHFMINALRLSFEFDFWRKILNMLPLFIWLVPITAVITFLLFNQIPAKQPLFINVAIFVVCGLSLFFWHNFDFFIWPLAGRFVWEFLLGASFLGGFLLELSSAKLDVLLKKKFNFEEWQLVVLIDFFRLVFIILWAMIFSSVFAKYYEASLLEFETWEWSNQGLFSFIGWRFWKEMVLGFMITFLTIGWLYKNREEVIR